MGEIFIKAQVCKKNFLLLTSAGFEVESSPTNANLKITDGNCEVSYF